MAATPQSPRLPAGSGSIPEGFSELAELAELGAGGLEDSIKSAMSELQRSGEAMIPLGVVANRSGEPEAIIMLMSAEFFAGAAADGPTPGYL